MTFAELGLATCSYKAFDPEMGTPVRTSIGAPRWPLGYAIAHKVEGLMPIGCRHIDDLAAFAPVYRARLEAHATEIAEDLARIAAETGKRPVMLCYESVHEGPSHWCHRTVARRWLEERTGLMIPELSVPGPRAGSMPKGAPKATKATTENQLTLGGSVETRRAGR